MKLDPFSILWVTATLPELLKASDDAIKTSPAFKLNEQQAVEFEKLAAQIREKMKMSEHVEHDLDGKRSHKKKKDRKKKTPVEAVSL